MDFYVALEQEMKTIAALGNRVYPLHAQEAVKTNGVPYCIYVSSEGLQTKTLAGYQGGRDVPVEINLIAKSYAEMKSITRETLALLTGMEKRVIGTGGPFIQELTYDTPVELYEDKPLLYRCVIDFEVYFEQ